MKNSQKEIAVGLLVLGVIALIVVLSSWLGAFSPMTKMNHFEVMYSFAGGVEVGSPVRVSGVKVGKVDKIRFITEAKSAEGEIPPTLALSISVSGQASEVIKKDSQFYINMAGIIGEKYIEVSPGTTGSERLAAGAVVRGVDPPRIDQLLSQGYGVFGKVQELLDRNEPLITDFLSHLNKFLNDANQFLKSSDKKKFVALVDNLTELTSDLKSLSHPLTQTEGKRIFEMLAELVRRAHEIDKPALKKFLQEEGIKAKIF